VLLTSAVAVFASFEVDLPERQLVTVDRPAGDDEQLAAYVARVYAGIPGAEASRPQQCGGPVAAELVLEMWRCHPVPADGTMTTAAEETAVAAVRHADLLLMIAACEAAAAELDLDGEALVGSAQILSPRGGHSGLRALLVIPVPRVA
jgi:hypothetical protein